MPTASDSEEELYWIVLRNSGGSVWRSIHVLGKARNIQFISSGHTRKNFENRGQNTSNKEILKGQNITLNLTTLYSII
jgi:hypothetical protein